MCSILLLTGTFGLFPTIERRFQSVSEVKLLILFKNYVELTLIPTTIVVGQFSVDLNNTSWGGRQYGY